MRVWWNNFLNDVVVPEEWRENLRMRKVCAELYPHIHKQIKDKPNN